MFLVPKKFFVTSGSAVSAVSELNAFDLALYNAEISEQNLVTVSSIIPIGAEETSDKTMQMGAITHCVLAQNRGTGNENIAAGIAYAMRKDGKGGYVVESHINGDGESVKNDLKEKMDEMSRIRGVELGEMRYAVEELHVPEGKHGCCVAALVFTEYR